MERGIEVYLESGAKRTFASSLEWPGWSRSGRSEEEALQAFLAYGRRYAAVVAPVAPSFGVPTDRSAIQVVERLEGGSGTDFGVPSRAPAHDEQPIDEAELGRLRGLLEASWSAFDALAETASGVELRKGPRGGGRDLERIVAHVREAEEAYLVQLGARPPKGTGAGDAGGIGPLRAAILDALSARARGQPLADPSRTRTIWTPRYFVRRAAWHLLDHAWEIEDRATSAPGIE